MKQSFNTFLLEKEAEYRHMYHDQLNADLWTNEKLKPNVKEALLRIAEEFEESLEMPELKVTDIIFTGSMANYNWTNTSDIDLHLVVKTADEKDECKVDYTEYFLAKKTIWNEHHEITIFGHPVELYVQEESEPHMSTGVYSVLNDKWNVEPKHETPTVDASEVKQKASELMKAIDNVVDSQSDDIATVEKLKERIKKLRRTGLARDGEFSIENLAFKVIRNNGYLEKLYDYSRDMKDKDLSLEK